MTRLNVAKHVDAPGRRGHFGSGFSLTPIGHCTLMCWLDHQQGACMTHTIAVTAMLQAGMQVAGCNTATRPGCAMLPKDCPRNMCAMTNRGLCCVARISHISSKKRSVFHNCMTCALHSTMSTLACTHCYSVTMQSSACWRCSNSCT